MATVDMSVKCDIASDITAYIIHNFTDEPLEYEAENGDICYHEKAQDTFLEVLDIIDNNVGEL